MGGHTQLILGSTQRNRQNWGITGNHAGSVSTPSGCHSSQSVVLVYDSNLSISAVPLLIWATCVWDVSLTLLVTRHKNDVNTVSRSTLQSLLYTAKLQCHLLYYSTCRPRFDAMFRAALTQQCIRDHMTSYYSYIHIHGLYSALRNIIQVEPSEACCSYNTGEQ